MRSSPDGTKYSTSSTTGRPLTMWRSDNHERVWEAKDDLGQVAMFSRDGVTLFSITRDQMNLLDAETGQIFKVIPFKIGQNFVSPNPVVSSPSGQRVAIRANDGFVRICNVPEPHRFQVLKGHNTSANDAKFSPDGTKIVSAGGDRTIRLWDARSLKELHRLPGSTANAVHCVDFSNDGHRVISASDKIKIWDARSGKLLTTIEEPASVAIYSPNDRQIASTNGSDSIGLWHAETGELIRRIRTPDDGSLRYSPNVNFNHDGSLIATDGAGHAIFFFEVATGQLVRTLAGHHSDVSSIGFSVDGSLMVSGSLDRTIRIWDVATGNQKQVLTADEAVVDVSFNPSRTRIVSTDASGAIRIWDAENGEALRHLQVDGLQFTTVDFSSDGSQLIVAGGDKVAILDTATEFETVRLTNTADNPVKVWFNDDGSHVFAEFEDSTLGWDVQTGRQFDVEHRNRPDIEEHSHGVSSNGRYSVTQTPSGLILVDHDFRKTHAEAAYRLAKAKPDLWWHSLQEMRARQAENWYGAAFHAAWRLQLNPTEKFYYDRFHGYWEKLSEETRSTFPKHLARVVTIPAPAPSNE